MEPWAYWCRRRKQLWKQCRPFAKWPKTRWQLEEKKPVGQDIMECLGAANGVGNGDQYRWKKAHYARVEAHTIYQRLSSRNPRVKCILSFLWDTTMRHGPWLALSWIGMQGHTNYHMHASTAYLPSSMPCWGFLSGGWYSSRWPLSAFLLEQRQYDP